MKSGSWFAEGLLLAERVDDAARNSARLMARMVVQAGNQVRQMRF